MPLPALALAPPAVDPVAVGADPAPPLHWLGLTTLTYRVPGEAKARTYEAVYRTRHGLKAAGGGGGGPERGRVDANDIIAVTRSVAHPELHGRVVVVMQYRPPVHAHTLEFPAGCIDPHETDALASALRELREETGLVGAQAKLDYKFTYEPGISRSCGYAVTCEVDLDAPENADPRPHLEDGEFSLRTFLLPMDGLHQILTEFTAKHDDVIVDSRLGAFALGLEYAKRFGK